MTILHFVVAQSCRKDGARRHHVGGMIRSHFRSRNELNKAIVDELPVGFSNLSKFFRTNPSSLFPSGVTGVVTGGQSRGLRSWWSGVWVTETISEGSSGVWSRSGRGPTHGPAILVAAAAEEGGVA